MKTVLFYLSVLLTSHHAYSQDKWLFNTIDNNHLLFIQSGFHHENTQNNKERIIVEYLQEKPAQNIYNHVTFTYNPANDRPWNYELETTSETLYNQYLAAFEDQKPLMKEGWEASYPAGNGTYSVSFKTSNRNGVKLYVIYVSLKR